MLCVGFVEECNHGEAFERGCIAWFVLVVWREVDVLDARERGDSVWGWEEREEEFDKRRDASVVYRDVFLGLY